jgi:hypothetical protein
MFPVRFFYLFRPGQNWQRARILMSIAILFAPLTTHAFTEEERLCATMFRECSQSGNKSDNCNKIKKLTKDFGYHCKDVKRKVDRIFSCFDNGDEQIDRTQPNWISVSWDNKKPAIFGFCEAPGAETARKCAVKKCIEGGGKQCIPACNVFSGRKLRACRKGTLTYVASSDYGRFGCGTRYIESGVWTPHEYALRELERCQKKSQFNDCTILKTWQ